MKIVDLNTFLATPAGTIFTEYDYVHGAEYNPILVKTFAYPPSQRVFFAREAVSIDIRETAKTSPEGYSVSIPASLSEPRRHASTKTNGFDGSEFFAIWDRDDIDNLHAELTRQLRECPALYAEEDAAGNGDAS